MVFYHLHYKMPIYKDCTLTEILLVALASLTILTIIFSILTGIFFGILWIGYLVATLLIIPVTRILLGRLQKVKYGKPYGYYQHLIIKRLQHSPLNQVTIFPFLIRLGRWGVRYS